MRLAVALIAVTAGCFAPQLTENPQCSDDGRCPAGMLCAEGICLTSTCTGYPDGARCATRTTGEGVCFSGMCASMGCGDGVRADREVCDDGNRADGDGCNSTCTSDETCGSGVVDPGEQCDDSSVATSGDGCSGTCRAEHEIWSQRTASAFDDVEIGFAYDPLRGVVVGYGGREILTPSLHFSDDLWTWDGDVWGLSRFAQPGPQRASPGLSFDLQRKRLLLFGGTSRTPSTTPVQTTETWSFDGVRWQQHAPAHSPPPRSTVTLVYDAAHDRTVLVGNQEALSTWSWDGTDWTEATTTLPPCASPSATYDENTRTVVMFCGGVGATLYSWTGTEWASLGGVPVTLPGVIAFDATRGKTVLVTSDGAMHEWRSTTGWTTRDAGTLTRAHQVVMVYDRRRQRLVAIGEHRDLGVGYRTVQELGSNDGDHWTTVDLGATAFSPVGAPNAAYDAYRGRFVLFGGLTSNTISDATWEFDGWYWRQRRTTVHPPPSFLGTGVYDSYRRRTVVFGGANTVLGTSQLWEWDGNSWTDRTQGTMPPPRWQHAMVYDPIRKRVVVHGGIGADSQQRADTWTWDGTTWTELASAQPRPAAGSLLVWDAQREQIVRFTGEDEEIDDAPTPGETWILDGDTWERRQPTTSPPGRRYSFAAYDPARGTVVMHGGARGSLGNAIRRALDDTWEWTGDDWRSRRSNDPFYSRYAGAATYDPIRRRWMTVGGLADEGPNVGYFDNVWDLGFVPVGSDELESCVDAAVDDDGDGLAGCADPDCWGRCTPFCTPRAKTCDMSLPRCGDGACNSFLEDYLLCPADCAAP